MLAARICGELTQTSRIEVNLLECKLQSCRAHPVVTATHMMHDSTKLQLSCLLLIGTQYRQLRGMNNVADQDTTFQEQRSSLDLAT